MLRSKEFVTLRLFYKIRCIKLQKNGRPQIIGYCGGSTREECHARCRNKSNKLLLHHLFLLLQFKEQAKQANGLFWFLEIPLL
jgi:hypothetical protein